MNTKHSAISLFWLSLLAIAGFGQTILKNKDVIDLVRAGLDADIIVEKISASDTDFDTSTEALIKLSEANVPKAVITGMIKKHREEQGRQKTSASNRSEFLAEIPEQGSLSDLKGLKTFYVASGDSKARERIIKEVEKVGFKSTDSFETADFYMRYDEEERPKEGTRFNTKIGYLDVFMRSANVSLRVRNIYTVQREKFYVFTAEPAEAVAKQFVKDYKDKR